jgi:ferric-dicitrate binding protein FerR (iron transport regulator)
MENNSTYNLDLITRYFAGEATSDEILALSSWIKSSVENQKLFEEYQNIWDKVEEDKINSSINIDDEWNKIKFLLSESAGEEKDVKIVQMDTAQVFKPNYFTKFLRVAAIFIFFAISASVIYYYLRNDKMATQHLVAQNNSLESRLPDGTSVTLNAGSTLEYPQKFKGSKRTVALKGEAYFDVVHNEDKPFVIEANDIRIKDIGTSFYINTNSSDGQGEVILTSGKVAVYYKNAPDKVTILEPGEKAVFSKTEQKIVKSENDNVNYMAFKTKELIFANTPLGDVVKELNSVYHSNITLKNKKIANYTLSGNYTNLALDAILKIIQEALPVSINKSSGNVIEISGNGCKK